MNTPTPTPIPSLNPEDLEGKSQEELLAVLDALRNKAGGDPRTLSDADLHVMARIYTMLRQGTSGPKKSTAAAKKLQPPADLTAIPDL